MVKCLICARRQLLRSGALVLLVLSALGAQSCCMAQQTWPLWQKYAAKFLDGSGRIIDRSANDRTTSEGQAYALFFALVANDRPHFDQLLRWTEDNLAGGDLTAHLPAWNWGKTPAGEWKQMDSNSAADADMWLAYDCLEAGRLWRDTRLMKLGSTLAGEIAHTEIETVPLVGTVLLPGPQGFKTGPSSYFLNPSYIPPQLVARFRQVSPNGPWQRMQQALPVLLAKSAPSGFASDWVSAGTSVAPSLAPSVAIQGNSLAPSGSYDAVRVYLWLGMAERSTPGVRDGLSRVPGMASYLSANALPPLVVEASGKVVNPFGTIGFSAAVYPYLVTLGKKSEARTQMDRLDASIVGATGLYGRSGEYYDQNLAMFAKGWSEQRFRFDREGRLKVKWQ